LVDIGNQKLTNLRNCWLVFDSLILFNIMLWLVSEEPISQASLNARHKFRRARMIKKMPVIITGIFLFP
jgi:hypothetical protein